MTTSTSLKPSRRRLPQRLPQTEEIQQERARRSLHEFILRTYPGVYESGWFHEDVCRRLDKFLEDVRLKKSPRLLLQAPPRHGKSEIVSRRFPAFALGRNPELSMIATSYGLDLASRMNRDVQRIITSRSYSEIFPKTRLFGKNIKTIADGSFLRNSETFEVVEHSGVYRCAGVGGGITGMGADVLLIDDPIKDASQAYSETYRERVWDWYTSTAYTRLMPGGGILLVMTRWHEDDLAGRLLEAERQGGEHWDVVNYPAIAEEKELHRNIGQALHPERYDLERLHAIKLAVGSAVWNALYQQRPAPEDGAMFKRHWFSRRWRKPGEPSIDGLETVLINPTRHKWAQQIIVMDATFKKTLDSDFVCIGVWGYDPPDRYLLDLRWEQMGLVDTMRALLDLSAKWPKARAKLIEEAANGYAVIEILKRKIPGIIEMKPLGGKVARATAISPYAEGGNVILPAYAPWVNDFIEEVVTFPRAKHDDTVDMMSYALMRLSTSSAGERFKKLAKMG